MEDREIAARVGADPAMLATLREDRLARLVTATGAPSRDDVIAWLEFVPEETLTPALVPATGVTAGGIESRGGVGRGGEGGVAGVAGVPGGSGGGGVGPRGR